MGLAGKDQLHRAIRVVEDPEEPRPSSVKIRSARLYVANRRAKPMVSTSGFEHVARGLDHLVALAAAGTGD